MLMLSRSESGLPGFCGTSSCCCSSFNFGARSGELSCSLGFSGSRRFDECACALGVEVATGLGRATLGLAEAARTTDDLEVTVLAEELAVDLRSRKSPSVSDGTGGGAAWLLAGPPCSMVVVMLPWLGAIESRSSSSLDTC